MRFSSNIKPCMTMDCSDFLRVEIHILIMHGLAEGILLLLLLALAHPFRFLTVDHVKSPPCLAFSPISFSHSRTPPSSFLCFW